ncbi:MAG: hypothetical protein RML93_13520 [Anaerolineales bacterium]|nr:hypothetical protein [Anaerolineales bacterium]MCS7247697.1 hypothetical protein [Anaerolineales bacterium]MDW8161507.1 hypothetical protein [Anaerolineales bacterium]MDW8448293.1 hypothetical protein [Anaerolineales bacterium]
MSRITLTPGRAGRLLYHGSPGSMSPSASNRQPTQMGTAFVLLSPFGRGAGGEGLWAAEAGMAAGTAWSQTQRPILINLPTPARSYIPST